MIWRVIEEQIQDTSLEIMAEPGEAQSRWAKLPVVPPITFGGLEMDADAVQYTLRQICAMKVAVPVTVMTAVNAI